jgi:hypothetical protein
MKTSAGLASPSWAMICASSGESPALKSTLMPVSAENRSSSGWISSALRPE